jgi:hypothetical protein
MKIAHRDIWLCVDCMQAAVNGDLSGLDYHYSKMEAKARARDIEYGLKELGPHLVPAFGDSEGEFRHGPCECCRSPLAGTMFEFAILEV